MVQFYPINFILLCADSAKNKNSHRNNHEYSHDERDILGRGAIQTFPNFAPIKSALQAFIPG